MVGMEVVVTEEVVARVRMEVVLFYHPFEFVLSVIPRCRI
jgi:hypothetical protein